MIRFVPDHLKMMRKHAVKKLPFPVRYIPDKYTIQQICNKAVADISRTLKICS